MRQAIAELLIPVKDYDPQPGVFKLVEGLKLASRNDDDRLPLRQLASDLKRRGLACRVSRDESQADITIQRDPVAGFSEAYQLHISPKGVRVIASTSAGAYYGIQTLRELVRLQAAGLGCCRISDGPDFTRRGVCLDCSRGKVPQVATLKALIERLAYWKINELQLYIENTFTFSRHPQIGRGYSPFRPGDIDQIKSHCRRHHIGLVPSLASFGHMEKILQLEDYTHLGELPGFRGWPGGTTLCPIDPGSIKLLDDLYDEFLPLFDAEDFNVCADEPWELGQGRSRNRARRIGRGRLYLEFILKLHRLCEKHHKRMNLWGDIVLEHPEIIPEVPKDIVLLNWDYDPDGPRMGRTGEFTAAGLPLVCCPGTHGWNSHGTRMHMARENISQFARVGLEHQAQGLLTTDWGDAGHRNTLGVSLFAMAHGGAHAWHTRGVDDGAFLSRFTFHMFGDRTGRIDRALETIGDADFDTWAYHSLTEKMAAPEIVGFHEPVNRPLLGDVTLTSAQLEAKLAATRSSSLPAPTADLHPFEAIALEEYELANRMNHLALIHLQLARAVRAQRRPSMAKLRDHAQQLAQLSLDFKRIWLLRNRSSRLVDNLARFQALQAEAEQLAAQ